MSAFSFALLQYQAASSICRWRPPLRAWVEGGGDTSALWKPASLELSVVLPCHNAAPGLGAVLERLLDRLQEVGSYEIIVPSDGSTDETVEIADSFPVEHDTGHPLSDPRREGACAPGWARGGKGGVRSVLRRRR